MPAPETHGDAGSDNIVTSSKPSALLWERLLGSTSSPGLPLSNQGQDRKREPAASSRRVLRQDIDGPRCLFRSEGLARLKEGAALTCSDWQRRAVARLAELPEEVATACRLAISSPEPEGLPSEADLARAELEQIIAADFDDAVDLAAALIETGHMTVPIYYHFCALESGRGVLEAALERVHQFFCRVAARKRDRLPKPRVKLRLVGTRRQGRRKRSGDKAEPAGADPPPKRGRHPTTRRRPTTKRTNSSQNISAAAIAGKPDDKGSLSGALETRRRA
jgi:hypothetical protein